MSKPLLIGLTGGIGSGKTTVAKLFKSLGIPIFNSDVVAKHLINNNSELIAAIKTEFGEVYQQGKLDAKKMAALVFNDKEALARLNAIVHPQVQLAFEIWVKQNATEKIVLKEAAILFETGAYKILDATILVVAPEALKIKRVMNRDGVGSDAVKNRMQNQLPDEEKKKLANYIIVNDDKQLLMPQVLDIVEMVMA